MKTKVVNIHYEAYDVYCGRAGKGKDGYFGNPFKLDKGKTRDEVIEQYRQYFYQRLATDAEFKRRVHELKGKRLGCFCAPKSCHAHVIANYLDNEAENNTKLTLPACWIQHHNILFSSPVLTFHEGLDEDNQYEIQTLSFLPNGEYKWSHFTPTHWYALPDKKQMTQIKQHE